MVNIFSEKCKVALKCPGLMKYQTITLNIFIFCGVKL